ncbi:MAG: [FeFe] hydrogenase, group A [Patescibacteria group bacterium]|nr:[FeFe] hydrogenase, group A [Patescibacteria group bacterium]
MKKVSKFQRDNYLKIDLEKCIGCKSCVMVCKNQGIERLKVDDDGKKKVSENDSNPCVFCGQCITHCPVNAITTNPRFFNQVKENLDNSDYINVAQVAPAIRASIGEEFDLDYGEVSAGKLVSGLKKAGFDYVFDTCFGADVTTIEEAKELIRRLKSGDDLPMFTSCCPSWVRYLGSYKKDLLHYLTSVHSPQMILARIVKTLWASKMHIPIEKIRMVSIMPCVAKKWESERRDYRINGHWPVDQVITTVETANLFKEKEIDFKKLKEENFDNPFGEASGGGYIYGASGGVMLSALRTAYYYLTGHNLKEFGLNILSGQDELKEFEVKIEGRNLRAAVVNGLGNFSKVSGNLDNYDYIEVMACPGGCIGGGGQPKPVNDEIRNKRAEVLIGLDTNSKTRFAHENPMVRRLYDEFLVNEKIRREITHFHRLQG